MHLALSQLFRVRIHPHWLPKPESINHSGAGLDTASYMEIQFHVAIGVTCLFSEDQLVLLTIV